MGCLELLSRQPQDEVGHLSTQRSFCAGQNFPGLGGQAALQVGALDLRPIFELLA